jgi:hypothetical protein
MMMKRYDYVLCNCAQGPHLERTYSDYGESMDVDDALKLEEENSRLRKELELLKKEYDEMSFALFQVKELVKDC